MISRSSLSILVALIFLGTGLVQGASYAKGPDPEKAKEIRKELKDARFLKSLLDAKAAINSNVEGRCGRWIKTARKFRKALKTLNAKYKGRYNAAYQKKFKELKKRNNLAFKDYENCFAANLRQYPAITQRYIYAYPAFRARLKRYDKQFEKVANLDTHIAELEEALLRSRRGDVIGTLASASGRVRIYPLHSEIMRKKEKGFWDFVGAGQLTDVKYNALISGHKFREKDRLVTGPNGLARIVFSPGYANGGTAVMNVGPYTDVRLGRHSVRTASRAPTPLVNLLNGTVRVLLSPFGAKKDGGFHVRTGAAVASAGRSGRTSLVLRGTEGSLSFDPKTGVTKAHLSHGDAYLVSSGRKVTLAPGTSRTVSNGRIGASKTLSKSQWNRIVAATGTGRSEPGAAAKFGTGPRKTRTRKRSGNRQAASVPPGNNTKAAKITRQYAKSVVDNLLFAFRVNDEKALLARTSGKFYRAYRKKLATHSLKTILDKSGDRAKSHKFRCTSCDMAKGSCEVLVNVQRAGDKPGQPTPMIFGLKSAGRDFEFKAHNVTLGKGKRLKRFMATRPVCEKR
ncbi:MAG: hypothetical protein GKS01_16195 [Alphaproteobacteria bacterium]|nr:hypothetical protein [Alphaproteobacteria bacterium]